MFVNGWQQALTLIAVLLPGFVFQGVLRGRLGPSPEDKELTARLLRALAISVGLLLAYILCLGDALLDRLVDPQHRFSDHPRLTGIVGFLLVFVVPAVGGHLTASFLTRQSYNRTAFWQTIFTKASGEGSMSWKRALFSTESNYNPVPTAWDFATGSVDPESFVRILNAEGQWIGGRVTGAAYFTSYPEPRDVFIDEAWSLDENGEFQDILPGPTGMWVPCADAQLMQIIPAPEPDLPDNDTDDSEPNH